MVKFIEPLIISGKIPPILIVFADSAGYEGDIMGLLIDKKCEPEKDIRSCGYLFGHIDPARFARHEKFFCEELRVWSERNFGASQNRKERAVYGSSDGAVFSVVMGERHPDLFGNLIAAGVALLPDDFTFTKRPKDPAKLPLNSGHFGSMFA